MARIHFLSTFTHILIHCTVQERYIILTFKTHYYIKETIFNTRVSYWSYTVVRSVMMFQSTMDCIYDGDSIMF
jgi:hypothetical protein